MLPPLLRDARTITVSSTQSTVIAGTNPRRVRIAISAPLTNPVNLDINVPATATTGWPLVVGGFPVVFGDGTPESIGEFTNQINGIAVGGNATVYVVDEFTAPE